MSPVIILAALVVVPIVLLMLLRVNAALVFLSLCLGSVLTTFLGPDANDMLGLMSSHTSSNLTTSQTTAQILLLTIPAVLTIIFMIKSVPKGFKLIFNLFPAIGVGLLAALLVVPLLPHGLAEQIMLNPHWLQAQKVRDLIVGVSALLCLFALLSLRPKHGHDEKHGKKHKG